MYIISGISNLIWGSAAIGIEIAIMMYSYSTLYQGLWLGGLFIGLGIILLNSACRSYHYMTFIYYLFGYLFGAITIGLILFVPDINATGTCMNEHHPSSCDTTLGKTFRWTFACGIFIAFLENTVFVMFMSFETRKSIKPPPPTVYTQRTNNVRR